MARDTRGGSPSEDGTLSRRFGRSRPTPEPRSSLLAPIGAGRRFAVVRSELASLTSAAHSQGGTVNDALLAVIAGGLRALLTERGEPVDNGEPHAIIPVALAHTLGDEAGNRLGQFVVRLPSPCLTHRPGRRSSPPARRVVVLAGGW